MGFLDLILIILLATGIIRGFLHGFIHEIAVLGTIFICYFFGFRIADIAGVYLNKFFHIDPRTMRITSIFVAWLAISVGIFFLTKLFEGLINIVALGIFNKIAGAIFGGLKYALIISLALYFFNKINFEASWINDDAKANSYLYFKILKISNLLLQH